MLPEPNIWLLVYLILGAISGFLAGLLGLGGGAVMVPILVSLFTRQNFPPNHVVHLALGTALATIIFTSISSVRAHHALRAVRWQLFAIMTPGIVIGTSLGSVIAAYVSSRALAIFFSCFMFIVAIQMAFALKPKPSRELPGRFWLILVACGIGFVSSLAAIGGGSMTVPFLSWCNIRVQEAIATSAAVGMPIAVFSTIGYVSSGWHQTNLPPGALGYVYVPALVFLAITSSLMAPFGARLAHQLPVTFLKRIFAFVLVLLAVKMLWIV